MSISTFKKSASTLIGVLLFLFAMLTSPVSYGASAMDDFSPKEIVAELKGKLALNDQQAKDLTAALSELGKQLHALIEKQEAAKEEDDPNEFIRAVKQAQADYQKKLKGILNDKQQESYNSLREAAIMDMMKDLAAIKLMDIQDQVGFSDDQLKKLTPVLAESMRGLIKIAWKYAGERLRLGQKIRVARQLKEIQHKSEREVKQILTEAQYKKWEELKKQQ
ncbi:MAG: hypothetical protein OEU74_06100 [Gammaproteobacteria bacterium]|nr:hypothetical protein [Gammaproteobacteria bacterium]